jgi:hypothetical protein
MGKTIKTKILMKCGTETEAWGYDILFSRLIWFENAMGMKIVRAIYTTTDRDHSGGCPLPVYEDKPGRSESVSSVSKIGDLAAYSGQGIRCSSEYRKTGATPETWRSTTAQILPVGQFHQQVRGNPYCRNCPTGLNVSAYSLTYQRKAIRTVTISCK